MNELIQQLLAAIREEATHDLDRAYNRLSAALHESEYCDSSLRASLCAERLFAIAGVDLFPDD